MCPVFGIARARCRTVPACDSDDADCRRCNNGDDGWECVTVALRPR
eukprot:gene19835-50413_t